MGEGVLEERESDDEIEREGSERDGMEEEGSGFRVRGMGMGMAKQGTWGLVRYRGERNGEEEERGKEGEGF